MTTPFAAWFEHRTRPWSEVLAFWGAPNLPVINKAAHLEKYAGEAEGRARLRVALFDLIENNGRGPLSCEARAPSYGALPKVCFWFIPEVRSGTASSA